LLSDISGVRRDIDGFDDRDVNVLLEF